jgi:hypothetical protein
MRSAFRGGLAKGSRTRAVRTARTLRSVLRFDVRKVDIPRPATASRPAPERNYKPRWGLNDISALSKSRCGRTLDNGKSVIWRMSVVIEAKY